VLFGFRAEGGVVEISSRWYSHPAMKGFPQLTVLLLILLLPSQGLCAMCIPDLCPMQADPEPIAVAEPGGCHQQMADQGSGDRAVVAPSSLRPDCCTASAEPQGEAPAVLSAPSAGAGAVPIAAVEECDAILDGGAPIASRWAPPPRHQPLYHLHSSLLI